jgi:hypothetical protein
MRIARVVVPGAALLNVPDKPGDQARTDHVMGRQEVALDAL